MGFAASGPIDIPVALEDVARLHEIFGEDQALAWDADAGSWTYAELAPAVRSFFRAGGHSVLGALLVQSVESRLGVAMPLAALFDAPTPAAFAAAMRAADGTARAGDAEDGGR